MKLERPVLPTIKSCTPNCHRGCFRGHVDAKIYFISVVKTLEIYVVIVVKTLEISFISVVKTLEYLCLGSGWLLQCTGENSNDGQKISYGMS